MLVICKFTVLLLFCQISLLFVCCRVDPLAVPEIEVERPPTPATRTVEIQTDYRDSETQTDPYTPEYVVRPGSQPELLTLATLSYGTVLNTLH